MNEADELPAQVAASPPDVASINCIDQKVELERLVGSELKVNGGDIKQHVSEFSVNMASK